MTEILEQIKAKRLEYSRKVSSGAITWGDVPELYVPEIFKVKRADHALQDESLCEDHFCTVKDLQAQGHAPIAIADEIREKVESIQIAWGFESFKHYMRRNRARDQELLIGDWWTKRWAV